MTGAIDWLYGLRHQGIKLGLEAMTELVEVLERPDRAYRIVHVAGTNGKGSVAAMVDAVLGAAGLRTGMFTSPHLVRPNERIRLAGRDIDDDALDGLLGGLRRAIKAAVGDGRLKAPPSFFETITGAALCAFRNLPADVAVLEVGLGGRLDATNVVAPDVTAIVSVGHDHTKTLGPTLPLIAAEKAGIVKPRVPLVSGVTQPGAVATIRGICDERGAPFVDARAAVRIARRDGDTLDLEGRLGRYDGLRLALAGEHQVDNARVALAALEAFAERAGLTLDPAAVRAGLAATRWPGRLQWTERDGVRLLLDAAHNPQGLATLARFLDGRDEPPAAVLFGATSGKPLDRLLGPLGRRAPACVLTSPPVERSLPVADLLSAARRAFGRVEARDAPEDALDLAVAIARDAGGYVLVTGSLYLVGTVAALLDGRPAPGPVAL